jgi:hypothetical protein
VAGNSFNISVTAKDAFGNTATNYSRAVTLTTTAALSDLPPAATLVNGVGSFAVSLKSAGVHTLTAGDGELSANSSSINVNPAVYSTQESILNASSANVVSGDSINVTLTLKDSYGNSNPTGVPSTSSMVLTQTLVGGSGTLSSLSSAGNGVFSGSFLGVTAGSVTLGATISGVPISGSAAVAVTPGAASQLALIDVPSSVVAGTSSSVRVIAKDSNNNIATNYSRTLSFTSNDALASMPSSPSIANGEGTYALTLKSVGSRTFTVTDGSLSVTSPSIEVTPAQASVLHLADVPSSIQAGAPFTITISAKDSSGNISTQYPGTLNFSTSDGQAVIPVSSSLTNGIGSFTFTFKTAGANNLTATDGTLSVTSSNISTTPAPATSLVMQSPSSTVAGNSFNVTITAKDAYNNTATGFSGLVAFGTSDGSGVVPSSSLLTSGSGTFSTTLKTVGSQTVSAQSGALTVSSDPISVTPGNASQLLLTNVPASTTAGDSFSFTVTAKDSFNNTATGYTGTVAVTSTDSSASLPASAQLTNGVGSFAITLKSSGTKTVSASDGTLTQTSSPISVSAAAASQLLITNVPSTHVAGTPINLTVTAKDVFNNIATGYNGNVSAFSSDTSAILPAAAPLTNGTGVIAITLKKSGTNSVGVEDGTITSSNTNITTSPGAFSVAQSVVTSASETVNSGSQVQVTLTTKDAFGNNAPTGLPSVSNIVFTSSIVGGTGTFSSVSNLGAGVYRTNFRGVSVGMVTIGARISGSAVANNATVNVESAPATKLVLSSIPTTAVAGNTFNFTVTARDANNNIALGYNGGVTITSSDSQAVLPPTANLLNGTGTFTATLGTVGSRTLTASDGSLSITSSGINVTPASASQLVITGQPATSVAGTSFNFTVTARDVFNNVATGYAGTVGFQTSDAHKWSGNFQCNPKNSWSSNYYRRRWYLVSYHDPCDCYSGSVLTYN